MEETTSSSSLDTTDNLLNEATNTIVSAGTLKSIYFVIGSLGFAGNVFVLVVILSRSSMRKTLTNIFIINQSLVDGSVALFLILTSAFEDDGEVKAGLDDELFCRLWLTKLPLWSLLVSSTYNLVALTFERFLAVVHPIWHKNHFSRKKAYMSVAAAWCLGILYNAAYMVPTARIQSDGSCTVYSIWPNELTQRTVGVLTIIIQFIIPLAFFAFCYLHMWKILRLKVSPNVVGGGATGTMKKHDTMARARHNIIKTLVLVVCSFIVCWIWNQVYYLLFNLGHPSDFTSPFYHFTVVMVFCNCCINPFIYMAKYEQFQKAAKKLFGRFMAGATIRSDVNTVSHVVSASQTPNE